MPAVALKDPRIGFLNFDPEFENLKAADQAALAPLFRGSEIPTMHVLFLYGRLNPDGTIRSTSKHVRDVVKDARAYIVVLASENPNDVLMGGFPWENRNKWGADVLFVNNRNGAYFQKYFKELFSLVFQGRPLGAAFVQLNPQGTQPRKDVPGMIWPMKFGYWTFENSASESPKIAGALMEELAAGYTKDGNWHIEFADLIVKKTISLDGNEANFHVETALSRLGALSGMGCLLAVIGAVRAGRIKIDQTKYPQWMVEARPTADGLRYLFGHLPNQLLFEARMCVWNFIAVALNSTGEPMPDKLEIAGYVFRSVGTSDFGRIRTGDGHQPKESPMETLRKRGKLMFQMVNSYGEDPMYRGWHFALAGQRLILAQKAKLPPAIGARIFLESAVAMAAVDPDSITVE